MTKSSGEEKLVMIGLAVFTVIGCLFCCALIDSSTTKPVAKPVDGVNAEVYEEVERRRAAANIIDHEEWVKEQADDYERKHPTY